MEKVKGFYQKLYKKRNLCNNYGEFLDNVPKISEAARAAMETDLTLEELSSTIKSKAMKDTAPGPDGIPYSVYNKLWEQAGQIGPLIMASSSSESTITFAPFL